MPTTDAERVTIPDMARRLKMPWHRAWGLVASGAVDAVKDGRVWKVLEADVARLEAERAEREPAAA